MVEKRSRTLVGCVGADAQPMRKKGTDPMDRVRRSLLVGAMAVVLLAGAAPAGADEHDPKRSGHPVRIVAYVVHPVGVAIDYLILRPAHWIGSHEPFKTIFGHEDD